MCPAQPRPSGEALAPPAKFVPRGAGAEAVAKGITANYAVFSSERIRGITFLANFQFFSLYEHKGINEFENTAPQLLLVKVLPLFHERSSKTADLVEKRLKKLSSQSEQQIKEKGQKNKWKILKKKADK